jgi:hypothetical protein
MNKNHATANDATSDDIAATVDPLLIRIEARDARRSKNGQHRAASFYDITALRDGRIETGRAPAYSGRPHLAAQIGASIQDLATSKGNSRGTLARYQNACSHLWYRLDKYEEQNPAAGRIDSVAQLSGDAWLSFRMALAELPQNTAHDLYARICLILHNADSSFTSGKQPFTRTVEVNRRETTDPYSAQTMTAMIAAFRNERLPLVKRFADSHSHADEGDAASKTLARYRSRSEPPSAVWTRENTLRFVRDELLPSFPTTEEFVARFGFWPSVIGLALDAPNAVRTDDEPGRPRSLGGSEGLVGLYRHFVPSYRDLVPLAAEIVCREGMNAQCVLDYDRDSCIVPTFDKDIARVTTQKTRAFGKIIDSFSERGPDTLYDILTTAIGMTKPLRDLVDAELAAIRIPGSVAEAAEVDRLKAMQNRVWLVVKARDVGATSLAANKEFIHTANEILARRGVMEDGRAVRWDSRRVRDHKAGQVFDMEKSLKQVAEALHHDGVNLPDLYLTAPSRAASDDSTLRGLYEDLAASKNWPKTLPKSAATATPHRETIVTPAGAAWLSGRDDPMKLSR